MAEQYFTMAIIHVCACMCVWPVVHVQHFATPWTVACQIPLSMGLSQQEYWSGLPFPPLGKYTHTCTHIYMHICIHTHTHTHTHTRFPYSSIRGHSCCFHILTTMNSAAKNNGVQMSPRSRFLLDKYSEVGPLDPIEALFLFFEEPPFCLQ